MPKAKTTEAPPIKLTREMRERLTEMLKATPVCTAERAVLDRAYAVAAPLVRDAIEKRFPPADMAILAKYGASEKCSSPNVSGVGLGGFSRFDFIASEAPTVSRWNNSTFTLDRRPAEAVEAWLRARDAYAEAAAKVREGYKLLIARARTLEEVEAVWPEARTIRPMVEAKVPAVLLDDKVLAMIRADAAARAKAERAAERKAAA